MSRLGAVCNTKERLDCGAWSMGVNITISPPFIPLLTCLWLGTGYLC